MLNVKTPAPWVSVDIPSGFSFTPPFNVQRRDSKFRPEPSFNLRRYSGIDAAPGIDYFVDIATGNDLNSGLDWANACKSIWAVLTKTTPRIIYVKAGKYPWANSYQGGWFGGGGAPTLYGLIGVDGIACSSYDLAFTGWVLDGSSYKVTTTSPIGAVFDKAYVNSYGGYMRYSVQANKAAVDANPGSYWKDGGTNTLYVHCLDDRSPDNFIECMYEFANHMVNPEGRAVYLENMSFEGGRRVVRSYVTSAVSNKFLAYNCKFGLTNDVSPADTVSLQGVYSILQKCSVYSAMLDLINVTPLGGVLNEAIEIDCQVWDGGPGTAHQCSSAHSGAKIIRMGGYYRHTGGGVTADVINAESWNMGALATHGRYTSWSGAGFYAETGAKVWVDRCKAFFNGAYSYSNNGGTFYKRYSLGDIPDFGVMTPY